MSQIPITFKQFELAIEAMEKQQVQSQSFSKAIQSGFENVSLVCTIGNIALNALVDLLDNIFPGEWVSWYLWDRSKNNSVVTLVNDRVIDVNSIERLWEVIHDA